MEDDLGNIHVSGSKWYQRRPYNISESSARSQPYKRVSQYYFPFDFISQYRRDWHFLPTLSLSVCSSTSMAYIQ